jgi:hypothetical protein
VSSRRVGRDRRRRPHARYARDGPADRRSPPARRSTALDEAPFHRAAEEARHDALAELDVSDDLAAVGEPKQWVPVDELGPHGEQRRNALPVQERPFIVDEVEATVAPDAGELELDRVDGRETQRLDGCDREPDDPCYGYSTSTWMRFFASFRNPPSR